MSRSIKRRWTLVGTLIGVGTTLALVIGLGVFAGAGAASSSAKPKNTSPPTISGTPQENSTLTADRGNWKNSPTDFNYFWVRCDKNGGSCSNISGAHSLKYTLTSVDVGNTLRFRVQATNGDGSTIATSVPTAVVTAATKPPPTTPTPPATGCPSGSPDQASQMSLPARLILDQFDPQPSTLGGGTQSFVLRVHVTSTCGGPVQGALVYGTPTPFNQFRETQSNTGSDGWATLTFGRQANFPVNNKQQILAMFLRASKPGENVLAGITGTRLVNVPVNLKG